MIFFQLIIPEDLGTLSLRAGTRGWFKGSVLEEERLAVARMSQAGDGDPFFATASGRLFDHWSFLNGTSVEKLVPWVAVRPGFGDALATPRRITRNDLTGWTADGSAPELTDDNLLMLCCVEPAEGGGAKVHLLLVTEEKVLKADVQAVAAEPRLSARLDGLSPIKALQEKRVAVVGVGSGGSMAAVNLAAAGVGRLHLFDKDHLTTDNLFRHACDLRHLGRAKVRAVRDLIRSYDLPAAVVAYKQDVVENATGLWEVMSDVDLVLCATDNVPSRRLVNYVAVHTGTPLVMACTFRNARIGEILRVLPGETACYECTRIALRQAGALEPAEEGGEDTGAARVPYGLGEPGPAEAAETVNQGTRSDVAMVSALQSRVAISTLLGGAAEAGRLPSDYLAWGGSAETELSGPFNFERPFSTNWVHIARREECPVCPAAGRELGAGIDEEYETILAGAQEE